MSTLLVANWKMNLSRKKSIELARQLSAFAKDKKIFKEESEVAIAPSNPIISEVAEIIFGSGIKIAAQDCSARDVGAYTGDTSATVLSEYGCEYVIVGHSERRQHYNEKSDIVFKKAALAYKNNIRPIVCVGETDYEREQGYLSDVLAQDLLVSLPVPSEHNRPLIVAYEPVWAIGSSKTPTLEQIKEAVDIIDRIVKRKLGFKKDKLTILYGGSVTTKNCNSILKVPKVGGLLIGGASLTYDVFTQIIESVFEGNKATFSNA